MEQEYTAETEEQGAEWLTGGDTSAGEQAEPEAGAAGEEAAATTDAAAATDAAASGQGASGGQPEAQAADGTPPADGAPAAESFELVYNGERLTRSREETIALAQKGLNYEKAVARATAAGEAKNAATVQTLERIAAANGVSVEQLLASVERTLEDNEARELIERGVPEEEARELVRLRGQNKATAAAAAAASAAAQTAEQSRQHSRAEWDVFVRTYPDKAKEYAEGRAPQAFRDALAKGLSPVAAQVAAENEELRGKVQELQTAAAAAVAAQKNRASAPGPAGGYGKKDEDEFLRIFEAD